MCRLRHQRNRRMSRTATLVSCARLAVTRASPCAAEGTSASRRTLNTPKTELTRLTINTSSPTRLAGALEHVAHLHHLAPTIPPLSSSKPSPSRSFAMTPSPNAPAGEPPPHPKRHRMVTLAALCTLMNYADRVNLSVAIIPLAAAHNLSIRQQSFVLSSFYAGYIPMQLLSAVLCRRFGAHAVLALGATLWSMFTVATPPSAALGLRVLLACRILMGFSEGVAFPSVYHFLSGWVPKTERGIAIGLLSAGTNVGTVIALLASPWIVERLGWPFVFYIFGSGGLLWVLTWVFLACDRERAPPLPPDAVVASAGDDVAPSGFDKRPEPVAEAERGYSPLDSVGDDDDDDCGGDEADDVLRDDARHRAARGADVVHRRAGGTGGDARFGLSATERRLIVIALTDRRALSVVITQALYDLVMFTILAWLPTYLSHEFKLPTRSLIVACVPFLLKVGASALGGLVADRLVAAGLSLTATRIAVTLVCAVGTAVSLVWFALARSVVWAIAASSVAMIWMSGAAGGYSAAFLDMADARSAGLFQAVSNTMSAVAGLFSAPLAAEIRALAGESWRVAFASLSVWMMLVVVVFGCWFRADLLFVSDEEDGDESDIGNVDDGGTSVR